jgi:pimeloyl-ACP methyl ester carboxylesterase
LTAARESVVPLAAGIHLHVVEWGAPRGWPVVILHGGGHDAACWAEVCRRLPGRLRWIVPDQRGHGGSDWPPEGDYSCAAQARDLEQLLRALRIERCALVGHSMGGLNALEYAASHPGKVTALVLVEVGTETRETGLQRIRRRIDQPRPVDSDGRRARFDTRLLQFVPTYCGDTARRRKLLARVEAPLLVARGEHSRILSAESAALTARLGKGSVAEIPGAGHSVSLDNPQAVAESLTRFLVPLAKRAA